MGFPAGSDGKESTCNVGDLGSIPGLGRSHGGGTGNPLLYSCLENPHGQRSRVGIQSRGSQRVGHDWVTSTSRQVSNGDWESSSQIWVVSLSVWEMDSILFSYSRFICNAQGDLQEMWQQQPSAFQSVFLPCRHMERRFLCWPPGLWKMTVVRTVLLRGPAGLAWHSQKLTWEATGHGIYFILS